MLIIVINTKTVYGNSHLFQYSCYLCQSWRKHYLNNLHIHNSKYTCWMCFFPRCPIFVQCAVLNMLLKIYVQENSHSVLLVRRHITPGSNGLTHWDRVKTDANLQPTFSTAFQWMQFFTNKISLKYVPCSLFDKKPALVQMMAWQARIWANVGLVYWCRKYVRHWVTMS